MRFQSNSTLSHLTPTSLNSANRDRSSHGGMKRRSPAFIPFCRGSDRQIDGKPSTTSKTTNLATCFANPRTCLPFPPFIVASIEHLIVLCVSYIRSSFSELDCATNTGLDECA